MLVNQGSAQDHVGNGVAYLGRNEFTSNELQDKDSPEMLLCQVQQQDAALVDETLGSLPSDELVYKATQIFSALADSTRFRILMSLAAGELCVCELQEICRVSQSAVSHQLRLLRDCDLVRASRVGQRAVYRLADSHVLSLLKLGLEHAAETKGVN